MRLRAAFVLAAGLLLAGGTHLVGDTVLANDIPDIPADCTQGDPDGVLLVCGDVPDGYQLPQVPPLPADLQGSVFVVFPSVVPDEGQPCPLPQDLGSNILGTVCGPVPTGFTLPLPPVYGTAICAAAERKLAEMKGDAIAAGVTDIAASFPEYDPESCRVWFPPSAPEPGMVLAVVRFEAVDPALEVPPVVVDLGSQR